MPTWEVTPSVFSDPRTLGGPEAKGRFMDIAHAFARVAGAMLQDLRPDNLWLPSDLCLPWKKSACEDDRAGN